MKQKKELTSVELLKERKATIEKTIKPQLDELAFIDNFLNQIAGEPMSDKLVIDKPSNEPIKEKEDQQDLAKPLYNIIKRSKNLLSSEDLYFMLGFKEHDSQKGEIKERISRALNGLVRRKKIKNYAHKGIKGKFNGLPELFEGETPKQEFIDTIEKNNP